MDSDAVALEINQASPTSNKEESSVTSLGIEPSLVGNPHNVTPEMDRVLGNGDQPPGFSETCFLTSWNPIEEVGLFLHAGRCPQDLDMWWAQAVAYLPDGKLAIDRSWGRSPGKDTVETGNFQIRMDNPLLGWASTFDGAAEITDAATVTRHPIGSGPCRPVKWNLVTEAAGPVWDLYTALGHHRSQGFAGNTHTQQVLTIRGSLTVDGTQYSLDGVAGNDHSTGVRDMSNFGSHHFLIGSFPGRTIHCLTIFGMDGAMLMESGTEFSAGEDNSSLILIDVPRLAGVDGTPKEFQATFVHGNGERTPVRIELLHNVPMSLNHTNDNINGVDWDGKDHLVLVEARVRMTLPDGTVGYAHLERSHQRSTLH
jgi:hypothetical protein